MACSIQEQVPLSSHTLYKIGGPARFFVEVKNSDELQEAVRFARERNLPVFLLGAGSNIIVSDRGFAGLVIHQSKGVAAVKDGKLVATADVMMAQAVLKAAKAGLSGFEWGIGVPGTIGGSVRGNAGCFGGEMSQVLESVQVLEIKNQKSKIKSTNQNSKLFKLTNIECQFGYRDSIFKKHPEWIILSAALKLRKDDYSKIQERIKLLSAERTEKQDIGTKSCGCIFKNVSWRRKDINAEKLISHFPELGEFKNQPNIPASFLIDSAGLKGKKIGKVFISPKHANYFVNEGGATAEEVVMLIAHVKDVIKRKFGVLLEEEIQYVGF